MPETMAHTMQTCNAGSNPAPATKTSSTPSPKNQKMKNTINNKEYYDLFQYPEMQPPELKEVVEKWAKKFDELSYEEVSNFLKEVESVGYTFNYYLDAEPYGLRPKDIELHQLKGYE